MEKQKTKKTFVVKKKKQNKKKHFWSKTLIQYSYIYFLIQGKM